MEDEAAEKRKRWSLTYTKHLKQKRKGYEDGLARPINLSPSRKIIREFKKSEQKKYGTPQTPPTTLKTSETEWQVLYTAQLIQKSKKYHDGFLRLSTCGALGRQVMLFDEQRNLLESRFLKRDVVIRSGESISLDAHLVEIGECNGNNVQGNDSGNGGKAGIRHDQKNQFESDGASGKGNKKCEVQKFGVGCNPTCTIKSGVTEWQVIYTAQVTKKAKKYHDGFLQLTNSGTLQRQIMLYDESKKLINSRFLKKDEVIQSGESITFDSHLVDVGELEVNCQGRVDSDVISNYNVSGKLGLMHRVPNSLKTNKSFFKGKPLKIACSGTYANPSFSISSINETKLSQNVSAKKPLRDAVQIISILQKPMVQDSFARGSIHKNIINPDLFSEEPQNSDCPRNIAECNQLASISAAHQGSNEKTEIHESIKCVDTKESPDFYSKEKTSCSGSEPFKNNEVGKSHQPHSDNLEAHSQETADVPKNSVELKISRETGGCPSFDLGFD